MIERSHSRAPWSWRSIPNSTQPEREHSVVASGQLDRSWYQGRGVYGGFTAALALEMMIRLEPQRAPRSFTLFCCAPAKEGLGRVTAQLERRGGRVSHLSARIYSGLELAQDESPSLQGESALRGDLVAFAGATFGEPRSAQLSSPQLSAPRVAPPEEVPEVPIDLPMMPAFCQHFRYRFCLDGLPYSSHPTQALGGWCDLREPEAISYPMIAALLDAWPPAVFASLKGPMMAASLDFSYHFFVTPDQLASLQRPFLYRGEVRQSAEGYLEEHDHLWDREGTLVATARQMIAVG